MMTKKDTTFLWGVTQIGQQSEGNCHTSNWTRWARRDLVPACGRGNDYWHRYRDDHDLVEELGAGAFRISIDWARIEPEEGTFDKQAIAHYVRILSDIQRRKIKTVVGLWHYSVPMWFEEHYGMTHKEAPVIFARFVRYVRDTLGAYCDMIIILNEPMVYIGTSYLRGERPPFYKSPWRAYRALHNLMSFHRDAYRIWKQTYPQTAVGSTHLWNDVRSKNHRWIERIAVAVARYFRIGYILERTKDSSDFIGINYYTSDQIYFRGLKYLFTGIAGFHGTADWHSPDVWRAFPAGLERVLRAASIYAKPLYVFENGKPTVGNVDDVDRQELLTQSIMAVDHVRKDGVDVRGYFHYALADAYEWMSGYDFMFGLVEINRDTLERTKRKSFTVYKNIIKTHEHIS